ncbi:MAG: conserved rane protein with hydrolase [Microbacteriaceae bacterium]|jgi:endonuclease/exonuclease/phosphatase (EEP) superfamily protein YafD|nr:conserved rane protein with hydrolase [Microbacteriaceae bacterium]
MFRRILASVVLVVVAGILLVLAWPQLFGLHRTFGVAHVVSLRAAAAIIGVALILVLLLVVLIGRAVRRFAASLAVLVLVFVLVNAAVLSTRGFGDTALETAAESDLTVLSWNTLGDEPGADVVAKLAIDAGADIVTLPETTEGMAFAIAALMKAAGRPMWLKTTHFDEISKSRSTSVLWSSDLGAYSIDETLGSTSTLPSVIMRPDDGDGPVIVAVHAVAPITAEFDNWRADLDWLAGVCVGGNTIMAGDFNATLDHMTRLGNAEGTAIGDCNDAALATGNGAVGTWPTTVPALVGSPIDHVMATANWRVTGMRVVQSVDGAGSDHRPIIARLQPAE